MRRWRITLRPKIGYGEGYIVQFVTAASREKAVRKILHKVGNFFSVNTCDLL